MKYSKTWISINDQIELLTKGKGLECNNIGTLRKALETVGYYRLTAYWFPYKMTSDEGKAVFREGTTFDGIMRTYEFDRRLRLLMFEAVDRIEVFLRSRLAYFAAEEDGVFGYPESAKDKLAKEYLIAQKSEQYIKHFAGKYGDEHNLPPYWMMVECATMGTLELLYSKVSPKTRTAVASKLGVKAPFSGIGYPSSASRGTHAATIPASETGSGAFARRSRTHGTGPKRRTTRRSPSCR